MGRKNIIYIFLPDLQYILIESRHIVYICLIKHSNSCNILICLPYLQSIDREILRKVRFNTELSLFVECAKMSLMA